MLTTSPTINAIGYVRRSTNRQEESLDQQRAKLQSFALARGWKIVQVYVDDAISGSDMNRPGLEALVNHAEHSPDVGIVLAWERNRLARPKDPVDGLMLERSLIKAGKRVFYVATGQEADRSFASGLISYVEHYQNGDYLRKLSRDTMRGHVARAERGLWCGGPIPFGFDRVYTSLDGTPRRIVRDMPDRTQHVLHHETQAYIETLPPGERYIKPENEACTLTLSDPIRVRAVQRMFTDYAAGIPIRVLRDNINAAGLRTARGRIFTIPTIHSMLDNPAYTGTSVYNQRTESKWHRHTSGSSIERYDEGLEARPEKDWIVKPNAWPVIIDQETFDRVQVRRKESKATDWRITGAVIRSEYMLGGHLVCGVCGGKLSGQTTTSGKGYRTRYYVCAVHHSGDHERCPNRYKVPAEAVEKHITGLIRDDLANLINDETFHEYLAEELAKLDSGHVDTRAQLQRRLAEIDQQMARLRDHIKALDPQTAQALGLYEEAKNASMEKQTTEQALAQLPAAPSQLPEADDLRARAALEFARLDQVLAEGTIEQKRDLMGAYLQTVKAYPHDTSVEISLYPALFSRNVVWS